MRIFLTTLERVEGERLLLDTLLTVVDLRDTLEIFLVLAFSSFFECFSLIVGLGDLAGYFCFSSNNFAIITLLTTSSGFPFFNNYNNVFL